MNPDAKILALQAKNPKNDGQTIVQVFNFDTRKKLSDHKFDEKIVFWTWANKTTLAIVTKTNVWHMDITGGGKTEIHMARKGNLGKGNCQIISYSVEESNTWCALVGIST